MNSASWTQDSPGSPTTHLLELPGLVLVGPLKEVQQDDVAEDGALEGQRVALSAAAGRGSVGGSRTALGVQCALQSSPADLPLGKRPRALLCLWDPPPQPRECGGGGMGGAGGVRPTPGEQGSAPARLSGLGTLGSPATTPNSATFTVMGNSDLVTGVGALATWVSGQEMLAQHGGDGSRQKRAPPPSPGWPAPHPPPTLRPGHDRAWRARTHHSHRGEGRHGADDGGDDVELASLVHEDQRECAGRPAGPGEA